MKKVTKTILLIVGLFILTSCQYMPSLTLKEVNASYMKKTEAEAKIAQLEKDHQKALSDNAEKITTTQTKVIGGKDDQLQAGADAMYSITQATAVPYAPGSFEFIRARSVEGFTAMGKPPTIKEIIEGGERLRKYLTTYQNNDPAQIAALRKEHDDLVRQNGILVETTKAAEKAVEVAKAEKLVIEKKYIEDNTKAQTELNIANNNVIDKEKERAAAAEEAKKKAEDWKAAIRQIMLWSGIAAALCLVGAIYSSVGKGGLATLAAVFGAITIALPFIQPWMIWIMLGLVLVAAGIAVFVTLRKHQIAEVANENIVHAIEDTKDKPGATLADLKANLKEWNTTYVTDKMGNVTSKVDTNVENYIKSKLMKSGRFKAKDSKDSALLSPPPK